MRRLAQRLRADWPWFVIGVSLGGLALGFAREIAAAVTVWNGSAAYGHCWLVLPVALWLLWERRGVFAALPPRPALWPALLVPPLGALWFAAWLLGIMEGRQLAALGCAEAALLAGLGWRLWWALSPGFLYLVFLVPFGAFLTPALQDVTAGFVVRGLALLGVPFTADAFRITIPEGAFEVAEACAGLRFLIASVAFGVLYAVTMFRSPVRRVAFIAVSCVVPVIANGMRALGIVLLGHALGSAEAGAADHLIYGWVFFSAVLLALALGGLPFRQAPSPLPAPVAAGSVSLWRTALGGAAAVLLALAGPAAARMFGGDAPAVSLAARVRLVVPPGCVAAADGGVFRCGPQGIRVWARVAATGANPAAVLAMARDPASAALRGEVDGGVLRVGGGPWMVLAGRDGGAAAYAVWSGGVQMVGGLQDRVCLARAMLTGRTPAVAVIVAVDPGRAAAADALHQFLAEAHPAPG